MDPAPVASSPDALSFSFSRKFRWMMIGCELVFIGFTILGLLLPVLEPGDGVWMASAGCVALFGGFAVMMVPVLRSLNDVVTVSSDGIGCVRPGKPEVFLRWSEVTEVRSRDGLQRLEIFDREGRRRIKIEYQLENFEELDRIIRERTGLCPSREAVGEKAGQLEFVMGRPQRFICVAGMLLFAVVAGFAWMSDPWAAAFFVGFAFFCLGGFFWEPHLLEIHDDRIILRSRLRERPIFFRDLIDVKFEYSQVQYGNITACIELKRVRGKPVHLGNFTAGAAQVFRNIRARWEKWLVDGRM